MRSFLTYIVPSFFIAFSCAAGETVPEKRAAEVGIKQCSKSVEMMSTYYLKDATHGADTVWHNKMADKHMYASFVSRSYSDGDTHVNMQFSPSSGGGCDASFTETMVMEKACALVREETFKQWKYRGSLNEKTLILGNADETVDVYMTPAGSRSQLCLITKREVAFQ